MLEHHADSRLITQLRLDNFLSFGPGSDTFELQNLNVLIGPNGSGKSNILEGLALLRASTSDWRPVISRGGGVGEWIWKGQPHDPAVIAARFRGSDRHQPLTHSIAFRGQNQSFQLVDERIQYERQNDAGETAEFGYRNNNGTAHLTSPMNHTRVHKDSVQLSDPELSVLRQQVDFPERLEIARHYDRIRLYREWAFGAKNSPLRNPQKADLRTDRLEEDFSNLGLFIKRVSRSPAVKAALLEHLRALYEGLTDFDVSIEGGTVQVFFNEGEFVVPAPRLSDGSVRYLCLLAILLDPDPPPLIAIEEPELGLHPDVLPGLADLLRQSAERTQLIVTTHSDILVDAMTETPEAIVVCEKHGGCTKLKRLDRDELAEWIDEYRLGQLWNKGQIGGVRW